MIDCCFLDLGFKGTPFTWCNVRPGEANVRIRLDRALATAEWRLLFPQAQRRFSMILGQITALLSETRLKLLSEFSFISNLRVDGDSMINVLILSAIMDRGRGGSRFQDPECLLFDLS